MSHLFAGTEFDRPPHCERCEKPETDCECPPLPKPEPFRIPPEKQTARIGLEKRKKGKMVSVIRDLDPDGNDLTALLTKLKASCGAGGSIKDGAIEVQGKHLDRIRGELHAIGYRVKG